MKIVILILAFFISQSLFAYGAIGHRIVAIVASEKLSAKTQKEIKTLLNGKSLAQISTWADEIRSDSKYDALSTLHYVNVEEGSEYDSKKRSDKGDLFTGIYGQCEILLNKKSTKEQRAEALKLLVHFMGDLHQPLHNGYGKDRGGNTVKVNWFGEETNLHVVWDELIIEQQKLSYKEYFSFLKNDYEGNIRFNESETLLTWHKELRALLPGIYKTGSGKHWEYRYIYEHLGEMNRSLYEGGIRLAGLLTQIFEKGTLSKSLKDEEKLVLGSK